MFKPSRDKGPSDKRSELDCTADYRDGATCVCKKLVSPIRDEVRCEKLVVWVRIRGLRGGAREGDVRYRLEGFTPCQCKEPDSHTQIGSSTSSNRTNAQYIVSHVACNNIYPRDNMRLTLLSERQTKARPKRARKHQDLIDGRHGPRS